MVRVEEARTHPLTDRGSNITTLAKAVTGARSDCSLILGREIKHFNNHDSIVLFFVCFWVVFFCLF